MGFGIQTLSIDRLFDKFIDVDRYSVGNDYEINFRSGEAFKDISVCWR